jgi:hypothetical protein
LIDQARIETHGCIQNSLDGDITMEKFREKVNELKYKRAYKQLTDSNLPVQFYHYLEVYCDEENKQLVPLKSLKISL